MLITIVYISAVFTSVKKRVPACVEEVSINTCLTDVFVKEVQVPVAQVAFLNVMVLILFYNLYVCFNLNYIVVTH